MKTEYLFSRNEKIGSKLISWGSSLFKSDVTNLDGKIPSHVAVLIDDTFVIESTLSTGVRVIPFSEWEKHNETLFRLPTRGTFTKEEVQSLLFEMYGKDYDWLGIAFFAKTILLYFLFKTKVPEFNNWEQEDKFFCTEFAGRLDGHVDYSTTTPAKMCNNLFNNIL